MTKVELKTSIKNLVNKLDDEKVLKAYHTLLTCLIEEKEKPSPIIGYSTKGEPLTKKSIVKKVKAASARVKAGKYISQEDVEKQSQKW
jgi:hypothetical protein